MPKVKIFFRADGNNKMGLGHVIRSLALAEMLKDEFECHFIIRNPLETLRHQILEVCESIIVLPDTKDNISEAKYLSSEYLSGNEIVVLDGYHFVTKYQRYIKNAGCKLVCIDDIKAYHFLADVIINHAGGLKEEDYSGESYTTYLLGLQYALLRAPFRLAAKNRIKIEDRENAVFICLGGADPNNDTIKVLKQCEAISSIEKCYVIVGGAYQHHDTLNDFIVTSTLNINLLSNLDAKGMVKYMQRCKQAITSPSSISFEYLSIGGALFLRVIADNQVGVYKYFLESQMALPFDEFSIKMPINKMPAILDGQQGKRFRGVFQYLNIDYRQAQESDCKLYYDWANDPVTRSQSFNSEPIPFVNHEKWFKTKLKDSKSELLIITYSGESIGQIRFDVKINEATISFLLDNKFRGRGLGALVLKKGIEVFKQLKGNSISIIGFVKEDNIPSRKSFLGLDFKEEKATEYENSYKYVL